MWIIVILMFIIMFVVFQNNKMLVLFDYLRMLDFELEKKLISYISPDGDVDVFVVREIRDMLKDDYVKKHRIDEFKVYKESMYKIVVIIRRGLATQGLELITNDHRLKLKETFIAYSKIKL